MSSEVRLMIDADHGTKRRRDNCRKPFARPIDATGLDVARAIDYVGQSIPVCVHCYKPCSMSQAVRSSCRARAT